MAAWTRYRETGYVLFAIWVAGLVDIICACVIPGQRPMLLFESRLDIIPVPVGLLTVFSFVLWLRLKLARNYEEQKPQDSNKLSETEYSVAARKSKS